MTKYEPQRDIPDFAREFKTLSPSKLVEIILNRRNERVTPESVTMWLKRHPDVEEQLRKELVEGLPTEKQEVDTSIFANGNFQELPTVKNWIMEMNARDLKKGTMQGMISNLRNICLGSLPIHKIDLASEGKWCLKHPDRLNLQDAMEIISLLKAKNIDTYQYKRTLKDFLQSKGIMIGKKIAVGRSKSYGIYSKLFVSMEKIVQMLEWIKSQNPIAYGADLFMLKTATRINATLDSAIEKVRGNEITVYDKGRRTAKAWDKRLDAQLLNVLQQIIGDRKSGKIFNIHYKEITRLNEEAIRTLAPEVLEQYPTFHDWNHFWRHMFAQHMLRATDWNYAPVASLGGWTPQALEESYGKPPQQVVKQWGDKYHLDIEVLEVKA